MYQSGQKSRTKPVKGDLLPYLTQKTSLDPGVHIKLLGLFLSSSPNFSLILCYFHFFSSRFFPHGMAKAVTVSPGIIPLYRPRSLRKEHKYPPQGLPQSWTPSQPGTNQSQKSGVTDRPVLGRPGDRKSVV